VLVLKWFLSTLKLQYSSRNEKLGSEKKPLNPFLGELFLATWPKGDDGEELRLVSEQVRYVHRETRARRANDDSHHPPVTAYSITTPSGSVELTGYNGQRASVTRSLTISVKQEGRAVIRFPKAFPDEAYLVTLPSLHVEGVITGAPYVELNNCSQIASSTGYVARVDYSGRGWLSGKKNSFRATLARADEPKKALYTTDGQWTGRFVINDAAGHAVASHDPAKPAPPTPVVAEVDAQGEWESRRAWRGVAEAIRAGDMERTQREKSAIENRQREMRRTEHEEGREWARRYFARATRDEAWERLAALLGEEAAPPEMAGGVWVWKGEREATGAE
jgi:oxysterol-binding protein-related protein 9/10/11